MRCSPACGQRWGKSRTAEARELSCASCPQHPSFSEISKTLLQRRLCEVKLSLSEEFLLAAFQLYLSVAVLRGGKGGGWPLVEVGKAGHISWKQGKWLGQDLL